MATKRTSTPGTPTPSKSAPSKSAPSKSAPSKSAQSKTGRAAATKKSAPKKASGKSASNKTSDDAAAGVGSASARAARSNSDEATTAGEATEVGDTTVPDSDDESTTADASSPWGIPFGLGGPPPDLTDLGAFIRNQREVAKLSIRRLAELANVSNPYLSQVERGLRNPSPDILQQVANALRISVESLYVKAGILPDENREVSSVSEAIDHDPQLSAEQKAALRGVYESFLASGN